MRNIQRNTCLKPINTQFKAQLLLNGHHLRHYSVIHPFICKENMKILLPYLLLNLTNILIKRLSSINHLINGNFFHFTPPFCKFVQYCFVANVPYRINNLIHYKFLKIKFVSQHELAFNFILDAIIFEQVFRLVTQLVHHQLIKHHFIFVVRPHSLPKRVENVQFSFRQFFNLDSEVGNNFLLKILNMNILANFKLVNLHFQVSDGFWQLFEYASGAWSLCVVNLLQSQRWHF